MKRHSSVRSAEMGDSTDEKACDTLGRVVTDDRPPSNVSVVIRSRVGRLGGVDLALQARQPMRQPPDFRKRRA